MRTSVMVAPIIPGLNDSEVPQLLSAASEAGACSASYVLLRLPQAVRPVFLDWLERNYPLKRDHITSLIRATREGKLNQSQFGSRMRGSGEIAKQIRRTFKVFASKYGLNHEPQLLNTTMFRCPQPTSAQLRLF